MALDGLVHLLALIACEGLGLSMGVYVWLAFVGAV